MTVKNDELTFEQCQVKNHGECSGTFSISIQSGGEYSASCNCYCHTTPNKIEEEEVTDHTLYEVDFVSITDLSKMNELAAEASELFGFDQNFFLAAVFVANKALTPDENRSFPMWKAYEEAKEQIVQGSDDTITLCTGSIEEGFCKVCKGIPGVVFTDTASELELHILKDLPELEEEPTVYGSDQLRLDLERIDAIKEGEFEAKMQANEAASGKPLDAKVREWMQRVDDTESLLGAM